MRSLTSYHTIARLLAMVNEQRRNAERESIGNAEGYANDCEKRRTASYSPVGCANAFAGMTPFRRRFRRLDIDTAFRGAQIAFVQKSQAGC